MRYEQQRAGEVLERLLQHLAAVHVQMVGGLVEYEEVVAPEHELGQRQPPPLAARERAHRLKHLVAGKQEQRQRAAHLVGLHVGVVVPYLVYHLLVQVQVFLMLVVIAQVQIRTVAHVAAVGRKLLHYHLEQRGLAHAVGAYQRHALARAYVHVHMLKQPAPVEGLAQLLGNQHVVAGAAARGEAEVHGLLLGGPVHQLHALQRLFAAGGGAQALFAVVHAVARDYRLLPGYLGLLQLVLLLLALAVGGALAGKLGIVAGVLLEVMPAQLGHAVAHLVQEVAVVRYDYHGAVVLLERLLQPGRGVKVEVIGGLVQQQQVGRYQQHARQAQPRALAARKQAGGLLLLCLGEAQAREHAAYARAPLVAARVLEALQRRVVLTAHALELLRIVMHRGHPLLQLAQPLLHAHDRLHRALHLLIAGAVREYVGLLGKVSDLPSLHYRYAARIGRFLAAYHLEQRGLARAIHAHQAHALALLQREVYILQYHVYAKRLGYIGKC